MRSVIVLVLALCGVARGQTPAAPTNLTYIVAVQSGCNVAQVSCVSQVNGVRVCPYGRVAYYPRPGQPYTLWTYPKTDPSGVAINFQKCVYMLPPNLPWFDPSFLTGAFF